jgi:hypothetical protein
MRTRSSPKIAQPSPLVLHRPGNAFAPQNVPARELNPIRAPPKYNTPIAHASHALSITLCTCTYPQAAYKRPPPSTTIIAPVLDYYRTTIATIIAPVLDYYRTTITTIIAPVLDYYRTTITTIIAPVLDYYRTAAGLD